MADVRDLRFRDCRLGRNTRNQSLLVCQVTGKRGTRDIIASVDAAAIYKSRLKQANNDDNDPIFGGEHHLDGLRELLARLKKVLH